MTYFDQIDPINDIFDQSYVNKPDWHNCSKFLEKKIFDHIPQILTYDVILTPKISLFWPFSPKMTYIGQIDPNGAPPKSGQTKFFLSLWYVQEII